MTNRIDFRIDEKMKKKLEKKLKEKGYKTISEFFREKAREVVL